MFFCLPLSRHVLRSKLWELYSPGLCTNRYLGVNKVGNNRLKGTDIVPLPQTTAELIPNQTAELIEKSFAENTLRNRRHALQKFDEWLNGRPISDGLLAEYITHLFDIGKAPGTISIVVSAVKWYLKHRNGGTPVELSITSATLSGIRREGRDRGRDNATGLRGVR